MNFLVLADRYSIYKFKKNSILPDWIYLSEFYSITRTKDELSVIAVQNDSAREGIICSNGWHILKIDEELNLFQIGVIAAISDILKEKKIPILTISTYDTDYFMVKYKDLKSAIEALEVKGHNVLILNLKT
jgi:hypothetical protein